MGTEDPNQLYSTEFEVFGQVQGCYFTKYCKEVAETIGIVGWVKNSKQGTIVGKIQGVKPLMDQMIEWLSTVGSPGCKIQKCDLTNSQQLARLDYHDFTIRF
ncbi:acylphosphatase-2 isoform X2 [Cydia pomonella]|uniref:acylphosphatase-2 isoform X2 n=1 Tax=Cydia pomonella TaxID=82600 RepID=UPI002ADDE354|nr:acylphosphatase-2 isoform X2 [Cydia pomonella]